MSRTTELQTAVWMGIQNQRAALKPTRSDRKFERRWKELGYAEEEKQYYARTYQPGSSSGAMEEVALECAGE